MVTKTYPWDPAEGLNTPEKQAAYLRITFEEGDAGEIAQAIGVVARAHGMTAIAKAAGVGRESLYKALREDGNPEMGTVIKVLAALGVKLTVVPVETVEPAPAPAAKRARKAPVQKKVAA